MKRVDRAMASTLRLLVRAYQLLVAPILPMSCRYYPSCSRYAAEALARHGGCAGTVLAVGRLLRCHPWGGHGIDPVPRRRAGFGAWDSLSADPSRRAKRRSPG